VLLFAFFVFIHRMQMVVWTIDIIIVVSPLKSWLPSKGEILKIKNTACPYACDCMTFTTAVSALAFYLTYKSSLHFKFWSVCGWISGAPLRPGALGRLLTLRSALHIIPIYSFTVRAAQFVIIQPWRRNIRDSMLSSLKRPPLQLCR